MADRELEVLSFLEKHPQRSFKLKDLARELGVRRHHYGSFRHEVLGLARAGRIAMLPRRRVQALSGAVLLEGEITGVGTLATHILFADGTSLPLVQGESDTVVPGDRAEVRKTRVEGIEMAMVRRLVSAAPREVFGRLMSVGGRWVLLPDHPIAGVRGGFFVEEALTLKPSQEDRLARGWLESFDPLSERPSLLRVEILGPADHARPAMERRIEADGWPRTFSAAALHEAGEPAPESTARRDLLELLVFTIDPHDAKDHDDAVSLTRGPDGSFELGVHIADVAAHVRAGRSLDREARTRATSVYPPGQVLPMLPESLSSAACSLHHGVARDAFSVFLEYDAEGQRRKIRLGPSRIRSRASLSYRQAEALLQQDGELPPAERYENALDLDELRESLGQMLELAGILRRNRRHKGSVFVDRPEREFVFDEDGHVRELRVKDSLRTHWVIEEFMLEANRAVAETLDAAGLPLLWRVHEDPNELKVDSLIETLKELGVKWTPQNPITGHDYQALFKEVEGDERAPLVALLALRSFMRASYRRGRGGHFGLAFEQYTHFTSPIRRYPDLHNQRWLHALVDRKGAWLENAASDAARLRDARLADAADWEEALWLADHCSDQERRATLIERACSDICAADWLADRVGERLSGMVTGVVPRGLFVELEGSGLDGFVGLEELPGDWYTFDERRNRLLGERTGRRFGLGQRVQVLLNHVDVAQGRVWLGDLRIPS